MNAPPTRPALAAVLLAVLLAAAEVWLAATATPGWPDSELSVPLAAFLAGPLLFLALLAWRRRTHPGRSRLLLALTVVVGGVGVGVSAADSGRSHAGTPGARTPTSNPLFLPLCQWVAVVVVWVFLVVLERPGKRTAAPADKRA